MKKSKEYLIYRNALENLLHSSKMKSNLNPISRELESEKSDKRWICTIDGGGVRGIIALHALRAFRDSFKPGNDGQPRKMTEIFDMFSGTSTGAIIASLLANGKSIDEVIEMYKTEEFRKQVFASNEIFQKSKFGSAGELDQKLSKANYLNAAVILGGVVVSLGVAAAFWIATLFCSPCGFTILAVGIALTAAIALLENYFQTQIRSTLAPLIITPKYKKGIRDFLYDEFGDKKLKDLKRDILITARDTHKNESTFFTAFHDNKIGIAPHPGPFGSGDDDIYGTYKNLRVREAVEASMSAPLYFSPYDRFLDGGVGSYNNPSAIAAIEAIMYSKPDATSGTDGGINNPLNSNPYYEKGKVIVWSFGTGQLSEETNGDKLYSKKNFDFWINTYISQTFQDANDQQVFICKELLEKQLKWIDYRRYQIYVNAATLVSELEIDSVVADLIAENLEEVMALDAWQSAEFNLLDQLGSSFAQTLLATDSSGENFLTPIVEIGKPATTLSIYSNQVITALGSIGRYEKRGDS